MESLNICASGQPTTKIFPNNYTNLSQNFFTSVDSDKNSKDDTKADTKEEETEEKVNSREISVWKNPYGMLYSVLRDAPQTILTTSAKQH